MSKNIGTHKKGNWAKENKKQYWLASLEKENYVHGLHKQKLSPTPPFGAFWMPPVRVRITFT
jgi:hypothetical protein